MYKLSNQGIKYLLIRRKFFLIKIFSDIIIFFINLKLIELLLNKNIIQNNFYIIFILETLWIFVSYIYGRYSDIPYDKKSIYKKENLRLFFISIFILLIYYLFKLNNFISEDIFFYFLFFKNLFCSLLRIFIINFEKRKFVTPETYYFIGSYEHFELLKRNLKINNLNTKIIKTEDYQHSDKILSKYYIYSDFKILNEEELNFLNFLIKKGNKVVSILDWCSINLKRYPSEFIFDSYVEKQFSWLISNPSERRLKRVSEFIISILLLFLSFPIILISSLLIKLEDGGPILYSQVRTGLGGKQFKIYKLRTMKINAEEKGVQWSKRNDDRITIIGAILRNLRIDELPQLISVFTGKMSLIGPRPERPEFDKTLSKNIPMYNLRYKVRPGLSGWAQVNSSYSASIDESAVKLSYDLFYIKNFSTFLDLMVFMKTIKTVFNMRGSKSLEN